MYAFVCASCPGHQFANQSFKSLRKGIHISIITFSPFQFPTFVARVASHVASQIALCISRLSQEVCAFLGEARTGTVSVTRSGERDLRRGSSSLLSGGRNGMKGIGGGVGGVRRDIDRIFEGSGAGNGEFCCWWRYNSV